MSGRGVHFVVPPDEGDQLLDAVGNNSELMELLSAIEVRWDEQWLLETDKSWEAIHRCLTDGGFYYGESPLHQCILGVDNMYNGNDYLVNILMLEDVQAVANAIRDIDKQWMSRKYWSIDTKDYRVALSEEDFEYTWSGFKPLKRLFQKAARHGRWVVFTAIL